MKMKKKNKMLFERKKHESLKDWQRVYIYTHDESVHLVKWRARVAERERERAAAPYTALESIAECRERSGPLVYILCSWLARFTRL